jgi:hypothetical protein
VVTSTGQEQAKNKKTSSKTKSGRRPASSSTRTKCHRSTRNPDNAMREPPLSSGPSKSGQQYQQHIPGYQPNNHQQQQAYPPQRGPGPGAVGQQPQQQQQQVLQQSPNQLNLPQLQDMAMRQQHQIESQQQMLVAKEQRLKYLRQQDFRHNQMSAEYERLRRLREKVIKIVITYFWLYSSLKP